jgi:inner membrane protein
MPTIFTHPAVAMLKPWFPHVPRRAIAAGILATILPDADVAAFALGIPYGSTFGHRGFTHSIVFAVIVAALATWLVHAKTHRVATFMFLFFCAISHPILDAFTNGGLGVAFFSPFSNHRYFFPWRPIDVSPIGTRFFSERGWRVIHSELVFVWLPCAVLAVLALLASRRSPSSDTE